MKTYLYPLFSIIIAMAMEVVAVAAPVLDQSFEPTKSDISAFIGGGYSFAQTFRTGQTGILSKIDVLISSMSTSDIDTSLLVFDILGTTGGLPDENKVLAQLMVPRPQLNAPDGWFTFDLSSIGLNVSANDLLAIEMHSDGNSNNADPFQCIVAGWTGQIGAEIPVSTAFKKGPDTNGSWNPCFGYVSAPFEFGNALYGGPVTYGFRTYVNPVPEPSSWVLVISGLFGILVYAYRRKLAIPR
jgi:hypothetical protein